MAAQQLVETRRCPSSPGLHSVRQMRERRASRAPRFVSCAWSTKDCYDRCVIPAVAPFHRLHPPPRRALPEWSRSASFASTVAGHTLDGRSNHALCGTWHLVLAVQGVRPTDMTFLSATVVERTSVVKSQRGIPGCLTFYQ